MQYRDNLKKLQPYKPGKSTEEIKKEYGINEIVKLASNENAYGTSKKVLEAMKEDCETYIYPDNYCTKLREKLSKKYGVAPEKFIFGNGSVEIIQMISRAILNDGDEVITGVPSFQSYVSEGIIQNAKVIEVPLKNNVFDLEEMLNCITDKTKLIYVTNPNNPTGTIVTEEELSNFINKVPDNIIIVLDEAYAEYVTDNEYPNSIDFANERKNVCVLRTFSKIYGLAGTRMGYGITSEEFVQELEKVRVPFNVSTIAQKLAQVALEDEDFIINCKKNNTEVLNYMYEELNKLHINYIKSEANFIMIDMEEDANIAFEKLLKKGFIVRPGFKNMENFVRVTMGTKTEMEKFIKAIKEIMRRD